MRITPFMIYDQLIRSLQGNVENLGQLNSRLATGKRMDKPSDDVIAMMKIMDYKVSIRGNEQYRRNIDEALSQLEFTDKIMGSVVQTLRDVRNHAVRGSSGNESDQSMAYLADGAAQFRDYLVSLSNSTFRERYIFSGHKTGSGAIDTTGYGYQGDSGLINVMIDRGAAVPVNVPGTTALSYTLAAEKTVELGDGKIVHYIPGAGTTVRVEVRGADDATVLDSFEFSNVVQMTDVLSSALRDRNLPRVNALLDPFQSAIDHALDVQGDLGARMNRLDSQGKRLDQVSLSLSAALSDTEEADMAETAAEIKKAEAALEALRVTSSRVLSQSLMDFLK